MSTFTTWRHSLNSKLMDGLGGPCLAFFIVLSTVTVCGAFVKFSPQIFRFPNLMQEAGREDFPAFYHAAELARDQQLAGIYDPQVFAQDFSDLNKSLAFYYPPTALLALEPLSGLPYGEAKALFLLIGCLATFLVWTRAALPDLKGASLLFLLASPGMLFAVSYCQLSPMVTALLVLALLGCDDHPWLSGILLGLATLKPQYGILIPFFLLARRNYSTITSAVATAAVLILASWLLFGTEVWREFIASFTVGTHPQLSGTETYPLMVNISHTLGKLGFGDDVRSAGQGLATLIGIVCAWRLGRSWPREIAIPAFILLSALVAPSVMFYDWPLVCAGLMLLLRAGLKSERPLQVPIGLLWCWPLLCLALLRFSHTASRIGTIFAPLLLIWVLVGLSRYAIRLQVPRQTTSDRLQEAHSIT